MRILKRNIIDFEVNYDITVILTQNLSTYSDLFLINYLRITYNVFDTVYPISPKFSYIYPSILTSHTTFSFLYPHPLESVCVAQLLLRLSPIMEVYIGFHS